MLADYRRDASGSIIDGPEKSGRIIKRITGILRAAQNNTCPLCGIELGDNVHVSHIVPQRNNRRGYVPANVFLAHKECNHNMRDYDWSQYLHLFRRADLIPTNWDIAPVDPPVSKSETISADILAAAIREGIR